jgi:ATPase family associated with various cellular activities (AAA)
MAMPDHSITDRPFADYEFADWPRSPAMSFRLYLLAAVSRLIRQVVEAFGTHEGTFEQYPFLIGYNDELAVCEPNDLSDGELAQWWAGALRWWESSASDHLPLRALRDECGLDDGAVTLLMLAGLIEEDSRFGSLFETTQNTPGERRPTAGLLQGWRRDEEGYGSTRACLRRLQELGLIQLVNADAPGPERAIRVQGLLWEALRGERGETLAPWLRFIAPENLASIEDLIIPDSLRKRLRSLPAALAIGEAQALIVRGPHRNGRRTLLGAVARAMGRGVLEIDCANQENDQRWRPDDQRWRIIGPLATMLRAAPIVVCDAQPGESVDLPPWRGYSGFTGVVMGKQGGVSGAGVERGITLRLEMPGIDARRRHWERGFGAHQVSEPERIAERFRLTSGAIRRAAGLAVAYAALDGREAITAADVRQASRSLNRQTLETLATHIPASGDWNALAAGAETLQELNLLEARCRHRERLGQEVGAALSDHLNAGVRALFSGPSGTGKTLAAKLLASTLQMDLYRLDLSAVVNKYIGETEKNLNQLFARAEELDVILLLDEGDALLTHRTDVGNANDRYANLETNFLLQRLESFEGILIVTTNAGDRIDGAFQRRMDVVISFPAPDAAERWMIWQLHLPACHRVAAPSLDEITMRCEMTGGQIRNAALHASLLALSGGGTITAAHLESAVRREYRKTGAVCPLRREF